MAVIPHQTLYLIVMGIIYLGYSYAADLTTPSPSGLLFASPEQGTLRLTGQNATTNSGRLEIFYGGSWGTICNNEWDHRDSSVACKQMGFLKGERMSSVPGVGRIWLSGLQCTGKEKRLEECVHSQWGMGSCSHHQDVAITCSSEEISIRLDRPKVSNHTGIIIASNAQKWWTFCSYGWHQTEANIACRELGFDIGIYQSNNNPIYRLGFFHLLSINCDGFEEKISECLISPLGRQRWCQNIGGVTCYNEGDKMKIQDVRISNSNMQNAGNVEVLHDGLWGLVLDKFWTEKDARAVCKQLNFSYGYPHVVRNLHIETTLTWIYDVKCEDGLSLSNCSLNWHDKKELTQKEAATVLCTNTEPSITIRQFRLHGGVDEMSGRLEIYNSGIWGSVAACSHEPSHYNKVAHVACKELGFIGGTAHFMNLYKPIESTDVVWITNITCTGQETKLANCSFTAWGSPSQLTQCSDKLDVNVQCYNKVNNFTQEDVRFRTGVDKSIGRVEIQYSGVWGDMCLADVTPDFTYIHVLCHQFGYNTGRIITCQNPEQGQKPVWLSTSQVTCNGEEKGLHECSIRGEFGGQYCTSQQLCLDCNYAYSVRVVGHTTPEEGRIEVTQGGKWGTICADGWHHNNTIVVCRQMGYVTGEVTDSSLYSEGSYNTGLTMFNCDSSEQNLLRCPHQTGGTCDSSHVAAVRCLHGVNDDIAEVRLVQDGIVESADNSSGRVEILHDGHWVTVCDLFWENQAASVLCKQMGFDYGTAHYAAAYGSGTGPVWLIHFACTGSEKRLRDCSRLRFGDHACLHRQDSAAVCAYYDKSPGKKMEIRLADGASKRSGRVEILHDGHWGTICGTDWTDNEATVVCRQLGYKIGFSQNEATFGEGYGPIWQSNVKCIGNETLLEKCQLQEWGGKYCSHKFDAGVVCSDQDRFSPISSVVLLGHDRSGIVGIYHHGHLGTICGYLWRNSDAQVVCRQLGYMYGRVMKDRSTVTKVTNGPIWLSLLGCHGNESSIADCAHGEWGKHSCTHDDDAAVVCSNHIETDRIRLVGGPTTSQGRVEVFHDDQWGTVCDDHWDHREATVVCKQLGFTGGIHTLEAAYGQGEGQIWLDQVVCKGSESNLFDCKHFPWGEHDCRHHEDAGVNCTKEAISEIEFRLVGGTNSSGRLEVVHSGQWGTICDDGWTNNNAMAICKHFGYIRGTAHNDATFGPGTGLIWLSHVNCEEDVSSIYDCYLGLWGSHYCTHIEDAAVICSNKSSEGVEDLRLTNGVPGRSGRVQVLHDGYWGNICVWNWDNKDATVVCRGLGFTNGIARRHFLGSEPGRSVSRVLWLTEVNCTGSETKLDECDLNWGGVFCSNYHEAAVICTNNTEHEMDAIRISDGPSNATGRLQVRYEGHWGLVCRDGWDGKAAAVACKQMGFQHGTVIDDFAANKGEKMNYWITGVNCTGNESSLNECQTQGYGELFSCSGTALVHCYDEDTIPSMIVRLADDTNSSDPLHPSGRVEVYHSGFWGTICDDGWGRGNAVVICRMLGYREGFPRSRAAFGAGTGQIWLDEVQCLGEEESIEDCAHNGWGKTDCAHSEDAGVVCTNTVEGRLQVRLGNGSSESEGRVEVYHSNEWGTVCDDSWETVDATVVCQQLGYVRGTTVLNQVFGPGDGPIWMDEVGCLGTEEDLGQCPHAGWGKEDCSHQEDAAVRCYGNNATAPDTSDSDEEVELEVRLMDGRSPGSGRVEVLINDQWGTVCDDGWDYREAKVVCQMLGYTEGVVRSHASYGPGSGMPIWVDGLECSGTEQNLVNCSYNSWGDTDCNHFEDVGVVCSNQRVAVAPVRLSQGSHGRVEVYHDGEWGTVCANPWGSAEARVICAQLGWSHGRGDSNGLWPGSGMIWLSHVLCFGNERSIAECSHGGWGRHSCIHQDDAGVVCESRDNPHNTSQMTTVTPTVDPCTRRYSMRQGSGKRYSSSCTSLREIVDVSLQDCLGAACSLTQANTVNFLSRTCSIRRCESDSLMLTQSNGGWDVYRKSEDHITSPGQTSEVATSTASTAEMVTTSRLIVENTSTGSVAVDNTEAPPVGEEHTSGFPTYAIGILSVVILVAIAIAVIALVLWLRRRSMSYPEDSQTISILKNRYSQLIDTVSVEQVEMNET